MILKKVVHVAAAGVAATPAVCLPEGAGARCLVDAPCVKLLCTIDLRVR